MVIVITVAAAAAAAATACNGSKRARSFAGHVCRLRAMRPAVHDVMHMHHKKLFSEHLELIYVQWWDAVATGDSPDELNWQPPRQL